MRLKKEGIKGDKLCLNLLKNGAKKMKKERKKTKSAVLFTVLTNHFYAKRHQRKSLVQMTLSDVFSCLVHPINTE